MQTRRDLSSFYLFVYTNTVENSRIRIFSTVLYGTEHAFQSEDLLKAQMYRLLVNGEYTKIHEIKDGVNILHVKGGNNKMEENEEELALELTCGIVVVLKAITLYQMNLLLLTYATKIYPRRWNS